MATQDYPTSSPPESQYQPPPQELSQQTEVQTQPLPPPPKEDSKGVSATQIVIGFIIINVLLVVLFFPFIPQPDYVVKYTHVQNVSWGTICDVAIKDGGAGGNYVVRMYAGGEWKVSTEYIDPGATEIFTSYFTIEHVDDFAYRIDGPKKMKSIMQIIAGQ